MAAETLVRKDGQVRVSFSKYYTLANMALSVVGYVTYAAANSADAGPIEGIRPITLSLAASS